MCLLVSLILGCQDGSASGGNGGAGGDCPTGEPITTRANELVCSFDEITQLAPHSDFDACDIKPNSACSLADFCAQMGCGLPESSFDERGCRRTICTTDLDCNLGETCYFSSEDDCAAARDYACGPNVEVGCSCITDGVCWSEYHCVTLP